ncbi:MAG: signal recognition particle-docking protein FtsY [Candidatus Muirbacterium halophilum]|nr:signal recognition particle-docking protein FtsY [Candidatus Muirbacterium halophilum]MCK9475267.1 signal recognition particle-docking protein FtsY [Candidatus Muirbacterium halophilum]
MALWKFFTKKSKKDDKNECVENKEQNKHEVEDNKEDLIENTKEEKTKDIIENNNVKINEEIGINDEIVEEKTKIIAESNNIELSKESWFARLKKGLSKTRDSFTYNVRKILNFGEIDADTLEELEELFIQSDIGTNITFDLIEKIEKQSILGKLKNSDEVISFLKKEFIKTLEIETREKKSTKPSVTLVVGVNGVGKTTTIGKLAHHLKKGGSKVMMIAGDTFRAAAIEQLEIWAKRTDSVIVKHNEGADSASVVFDGINSGISKNMDFILIDTAGRLHNKVNLMKELEKIKNVIKKANDNIEIETLLVIDSTSGQNGLIQARSFKQVVDIDGIILTKLDGTAKGGIIFPIVSELKVPVVFIGVGEGVDDLRFFDSEDFISALFD